MLFEGFVAMMALISACVLVPADYFAINAPADVFAGLGMEPVNVPWLAAAVKENIQGRTGGSVSLAVGMTYVFSSLPHMKGMMAYWYHFAIMFEAVFILSAVDAGTRNRKGIAAIFHRHLSSKIQGHKMGARGDHRRAPFLGLLGIPPVHREHRDDLAALRDE